MLITEWCQEEAIAVAREEAREEGLENVARNALAKGFSVSVISDLTGLSIETIESIA